jgi:hypothetical protein
MLSRKLGLLLGAVLCELLHEHPSQAPSAACGGEHTPDEQGKAEEANVSRCVAVQRQVRDARRRAVLLFLRRRDPEGDLLAVRSVRASDQHPQVGGDELDGPGQLGHLGPVAGLEGADVDARGQVGVSGQVETQRVDRDVAGADIEEAPRFFALGKGQIDRVRRDDGIGGATISLPCDGSVPAPRTWALQKYRPHPRITGLIWSINSRVLTGALRRVSRRIWSLEVLDGFVPEKGIQIPLAYPTADLLGRQS